ncbi:MAG TPA: histidinol-phosphate transaminase [Kofleriaceae bacterium]|nr:histidinol-phosphate transaminase [Kofleriaceae bacterium]
MYPRPDDPGAIAAWLAELAPPHVRSLDAYQPGKPVEELERELGITGAIKVASNENPLGPSPKAIAAIHDAVAGIHLYPDAGGFALRRALARHLGVTDGQIALGAGSNDLLYQLVLAFVGPDDEVLSPDLGFLSYRLAAQVAGRRFVSSAATPRGADPDALIAAMTPRTKLVVIGSPNNPTGAVWTAADVARVLAALPDRALLVLDEAYAEYAARWPEVEHVDGLSLVGKHPRVIVLRTFSKIYGLAALRVGYGVTHAGVVDLLGRVGRTFHVGTLAQVGAIAALDDTDFVARSAALGRLGIERLRTELGARGITVYPSLANFVLVDAGRPSGPLYDALLRRGVIVRPMAAWGLPTCLRVSIAAEAQLPRVIAALGEVLG